MYNGLYNPIS